MFFKRKSNKNMKLKCKNAKIPKSYIISNKILIIFFQKKMESLVKKGKNVE